MGLPADLPVPRPLRGPVYRGYARVTGANLEEAGLPLEAHPSLGDFFTRPLREGLRPVDPDPLAVVSPVDGRVQRVGPIVEGQTLQAEGRPYAVRQLLAGVGEDIDLEGGCAMTLYLSPSDYHRTHSPCAAAIPMRTPVKLPGPSDTNMRSARPLPGNWAIIGTKRSAWPRPSTA